MLINEPLISMYRLLKNKCLPEFLLKTKLVKEITRFWLKLTSIYFTESCENLINSCPSPFITKTIISIKHNILQNCFVHKTEKIWEKEFELSFLSATQSSFHILQGVMLWDNVVTLTSIISQWIPAQWYLERIQNFHFASHFLENYEPFYVF